MADDSIAYWQSRLNEADTPAEIEKCNDYLTHYRNHEEFLAGLAARRRKPAPPLPALPKRPLTFFEILCFPFYLAWLVYTGLMLMIVWVVFLAILLVLANLQWQHLLDQWSFLWR